MSLRKGSSAPDWGIFSITPGGSAVAMSAASLIVKYNSRLRHYAGRMYDEISRTCPEFFAWSEQVHVDSYCEANAQI